MGQPTRIRVVVKESNGCPVHNVGDEMVFECVDRTCVEPKGRICMGALTSLMPKVYGFHNDARFHWAQEDDVVTHACPDPNLQVVFEVRREFD